MDFRAYQRFRFDKSRLSDPEYPESEIRRLATDGFGTDDRRPKAYLFGLLEYTCDN